MLKCRPNPIKVLGRYEMEFTNRQQSFVRTQILPIDPEPEWEGTNL